MNGETYTRQLRQILEARRNPERAQQMTDYVRGKFPFFGIPAPERKELFRNFLKETGVPSPEEIPEVVRYCWREPEREFHYFGMELAAKGIKKAGGEWIDLLEEMITNHLWWDTVDFIASNLAGPWFKRFPEKREEISAGWIQSGNIWLQRTCLLFQLKYRDHTDTSYLAGTILQLTGTKEFFINKAIGWALRQYARTDPDWVRNFVAQHRNQLSGLSIREALKNIGE